MTPFVFGVTPTKSSALDPCTASLRKGLLVGPSDLKGELEGFSGFRPVSSLIVEADG